MINSYHVHVYFTSDQRKHAEHVHYLAAELTLSYDDPQPVRVGRMHDAPIGPHPKGQFQIQTSDRALHLIIEMLMLNREQLDVLVHPVTEDELADHTERAMWLGNKLQLNLDKL